MTTEVKLKINNFLENVQERLYEQIETVEFSGFVTKEKYTLAEALKQPRRKINPDEKWGCKWEYAWLFADIQVPQKCNGKRIVFDANVGECIVFVNGEIYGALDKEHKEVTLTRKASAGEKFSIAMEVYAGHGPGIVQRTLLPGREYAEFPEDICQKVFSNGRYCIFDDEIFMLYMDVLTLSNLYKGIDEKSLRAISLAKGLRRFCNIIDIEAPYSEFMSQVHEARALLKPYLDCKNGSTTPTIYAVGHSHLDLEWLWPVDETRRKTVRTLGNQIRLIDEYDEYQYIQSQPWIFETVKNEYPEFFEKVKKAVNDGNIIPEGGMWVEADTNIPSGESLIRQFLFGKRFIKDEFGKTSELLWLPDVFGCSAALPQIMKGCGVKYFMNAKVPWSFNKDIPFPRGTFIWRGIDGTEVTAHIIRGYVATLCPNSVINDWNANGDMEDVPSMIYPFGHGDGGGGAVRNHLEYARRESNLEGMPKIEIVSPVKFFEDAISKYEISRIYEGELWYSEHKGCYTSQAKVKKLNRKSENALREAEFWTTLFDTKNITDIYKTKEKLDLLYKDVLFNQFHDIIPGTSIARVYERAEKSYQNVIDNAEEITYNHIKTVVDKSADNITVFNSLSWCINAEIEIPDGYSGLEDASGNKITAYYSKGKVYAKVRICACGHNSFKLTRNDEPIREECIGELVLENDFIRAEFNDYGEMTSLFDKIEAMELLAEKSNVFRMYKNHPMFFDAWDIDMDYAQKEVEKKIESKAFVISSNDMKSVIEVKGRINNSEFTQEISLCKDSRRIDFKTKIDWNEKHKLLKVDFKTDIHTNELISEIQFGHIKRPSHSNFNQDIAQEEKFQHKWSVVCEADRGVAILNDCKYGISSNGGNMLLTLLCAPSAPMLDADIGMHSFTYSVYASAVGFDLADVVREGYMLNNPPKVVLGAAKDRSIFNISKNNIVIDTIKLAEDKSGDVIIRMYEACNRRTRCNLNCDCEIMEAYYTNMLEENITKADFENNRIDLCFKGLEVVTLRLKIRR